MTCILVTGGAGYIGSHTCKALAGEGFDVVVYDNLSTGHAEFVKWGPLELGALQDTDRLRNVIRRHRPDAVIHFAASAYVGESVTDPGSYYRNNVEGTLSLLEALRDSGGGAKIVVSSSCATYGIPERIPIAEDAPQAPINPYGATKLVMERMIADFETAHGIGWISLRYFNAAGADPELDVGERHDPETHLIPRVLMALTGDIPAMEVFGDDYDTPDGTCIRDYIHVTDLADAHVRAVRRLIDGSPSEAFNLGTGEGVSVRQILDAAARVVGQEVPHRFAPRRPGDPACLVADATKAGRVLAWKPRSTAIDDIQLTAWDWHCKERNGSATAAASG